MMGEVLFGFDFDFNLGLGLGTWDLGGLTRRGEETENVEDEAVRIRVWR